MKAKYKISFDNRNTYTDGYIVIEPKLSPSDTPYCVMVESDSDGVVIKNIYSPKDEEVIIKELGDDISIIIGRRSGKVFKVKSKKIHSSKKIIHNLRFFMNGIKSINHTVRYENNANETLKIIVRSLKKLEEATLHNRVDCR